MRTQPSIRWGVSDEHEAEARRTTFGSQVADAEGPTWKMHHGEFQTRLVDIDSGTVDAIITDPSYNAESLSLWSDLANEAERVLVPQGRLIALTGQILLPEVMEQLSEHLSYGWTYCQPMPGQNSRIMGRHQTRLTDHPRLAAQGARICIPIPMPPLTPGRIGSAPRLIVAMPADELAAVDKRARRQSVSRSQIVREAIEALLAEEAVTA